MKAKHSVIKFEFKLLFHLIGQGCIHKFFTKKMSKQLPKLKVHIKNESCSDLLEKKKEVATLLTKPKEVDTLIALLDDVFS